MRWLAAVILIVAAGCSPARTHKQTGESASALGTGHWSELPPAPIADRADSTQVWTGSEFLAWGGQISEHETLLGDGAAYNPQTRQWRVLPPAPIGPRSNALSVWTGREWIILGGYTDLHTPPPPSPASGAGYDPLHRRWRQVPAPPIAGQLGAVVWTGREVIALSSNGAAARYDPATDRWQTLPAPPVPAGHDLANPVVVWTGKRLLVWWQFDLSYSAPSFSGTSVGYDVFSFDPSSTKWRLVPAPTDIDLGVHDAYWTGSKVLLPAYERATGGFGGGPPAGLQGRVYDPVRDRYTDLAHGSVDDTMGPTLWTGHALLRFSGGLAGGAQPGDGAMWDPSTSRWTPLPRAPFFVDPTSPSAVWTGREVLMWGHLYRPAVPNQLPMPSGLGLRYGS